METRSGSNAAVSEVLHEDNYVVWSLQMKTYLMAHGLWDIVPLESEEDNLTLNEWTKKNAAALHVIQISCAPHLCFEIKDITLAKKAWKCLEEMCSIPKSSYSGMRNNENSDLRGQYVSFKKAIHEGNWGSFIGFLSDHPDAVKDKISSDGSTALHIAVLAVNMNMVKELLNRMPEETLKEKDDDGVTVLGCSALVGNIEIAKCIIEKSQTLLTIGNGTDELIPVVFALVYNSDGVEMARYLYSKTCKDDLKPDNGVNGATFITRCIYAKAFDMALDLLQRYPDLATTLDINKQSPVLALASVSFAYPSGTRLIFWKQWIYDRICVSPAHATKEIPLSIQKPEERSSQVRNIGSGHGFVWNLLQLLEINQIYELKQLHHESKELLLHICKKLPGSFQQPSSTKEKQRLRQIENAVTQAIIKAVKKGIVEFVTEILRACPDLVWCPEDKRLVRNIFMLAILHRQDEVFRLLYKFPTRNSILSRVDKNQNNILHMAAMFESPAKRNTVPGAAFLMQREVQWYKEVERVVNPYVLEHVNKKGQTPQELFTESHKDLIDKGEKWMKETATSCTVVGALIVTIMFAAAITVPGGNDQNTGLPTFLQKMMFMVFIIFDALSLLSASTSLLMFLSILTSRYAEEDFLKSLPNKMIIGLSTLIFSIATMMTTFCASLFIILPGKLKMVIPLVSLASLPVAQFAWMQFPLLIDMFNTTYRRRILDRKVKHGL